MPASPTPEDVLPYGFVTYRREGERYRLLRASRVADRILGFELSKETGRWLDELFPNAQSTAEDFDRVRETGIPVVRESLGYTDDRADGTFDSMVYPSGPEEVTMLFHEVSTREALKARKAEAEAAAAQERRLRKNLDALIDHMPLALTTYRYHEDSDRFTLVRANRAANEMLGFDVVAREGDFMDEIFPGVQQSDFPRRYKDVALGGPPFSETQRSYQDDAIAGAYDSVTYHSGDHEVTVVFQEVTETIRAAEALEARNAELERFAYVVSHDLKAPLRGIRLAVGWLRDGLQGKLDDEAKRNMHFVESRAARLNALIDGVLEYSRTQRQALTVHDHELRPLAVEVAQDVLRSRGCEVTVDPGPWATVRGDRIQILRVLQNLVENAAKFAGTESCAIRIRAEVGSNAVTVHVIDNGPGIPEPDRERVFELFAVLQPRDEQENTGLGLAICKTLVERWGGRIGIGQAPGGGADVWFTVPLSEWE